MTITLVDVGSTANDGTGDPLRTAFQTVNTALTRLDDTVDVQTGYVLLKDDSGTTGVAVTTAGNVGIGITNPPRVLTIRSSASNTNVFAVQNNDGTSEIFVVNETTAKDGRVFVRDSSNITQVALNTNGSSYFTGGGLGIGTTNPTHELEVANASSPTIRINDTGGTSTSVSAWLEGAYSGTQAWFVGMNTSSATMTITNYLNGPLTFGTNSAEYLRITSAGSVGIGTISPTEVLDVNSDAVRIRSSQTPASATATGNAGTICWDSNYIYVCTATNTWKRAALATW